MCKELIYNESDFEDFCKEMTIGKYIQGTPYDFPCVIVWDSNEYNYEFVYMEDFDI